MSSKNRAQAVVYLTEEDADLTSQVMQKTGFAGPTITYRLGLRAILALPARALKKIIAALEAENRKTS